MLRLSLQTLIDSDLMARSARPRGRRPIRPRSRRWSRTTEPSSRRGGVPQRARGRGGHGRRDRRISRRSTSPSSGAVQDRVHQGGRGNRAQVLRRQQGPVQAGDEAQCCRSWWRRLRRPPEKRDAPGSGPRRRTRRRRRVKTSGSSPRSTPTLPTPRREGRGFFERERCSASSRRSVLGSGRPGLPGLRDGPRLQPPEGRGEARGSAARLGRCQDEADRAALREHEGPALETTIAELRSKAKIEILAADLAQRKALPPPPGRRRRGGESLRARRPVTSRPRRRASRSSRLEELIAVVGARRGLPGNRLRRRDRDAGVVPQLGRNRRPSLRRPNRTVASYRSGFGAKRIPIKLNAWDHRRRAHGPSRSGPTERRGSRSAPGVSASTRTVPSHWRMSLPSVNGSAPRNSISRTQSYRRSAPPGHGIRRTTG